MPQHLLRAFGSPGCGRTLRLWGTKSTRNHIICWHSLPIALLSYKTNDQGEVAQRRERLPSVYNFEIRFLWRLWCDKYVWSMINYKYVPRVCLAKRRKQSKPIKSNLPGTDHKNYKIRSIVLRYYLLRFLQSRSCRWRLLAVLLAFLIVFGHPSDNQINKQKTWDLQGFTGHRQKYWTMIKVHKEPALESEVTLVSARSKELVRFGWSDSTTTSQVLNFFRFVQRRLAIASVPPWMGTICAARS